MHRQNLFQSEKDIIQRAVKDLAPTLLEEGEGREGGGNLSVA